ncbi:MAG: hypothetical protein ACM3ZV_14305 [Bacillota bacterium]
MTQTGNQRRHGALLPGALPIAGAALAGVGAGALLWFNFGPVGWSLVVVGCVSFLLGKIGVRRR